MQYHSLLILVYADALLNCLSIPVGAIHESPAHVDLMLSAVYKYHQTQDFDCNLDRIDEFRAIRESPLQPFCRQLLQRPSTEGIYLTLNILDLS